MQYVWCALFMALYLAFVYGADYLFRRWGLEKDQYPVKLMELVREHGEACRDHGRHPKSPFGADNHEEALAAREADALKAIEDFIGA
jgi:hypothetical protein